MRTIVGIVLLLLTLGVPPAQADVDFDATDDFVSATTATCATVITPAASTIMGWVRSNNTAGAILNSACGFDSHVVRDSGRLHDLGIRSTTQYCFQSHDGTIDEVAATLTAGWHHLAGTHAGGTLTIYVDGVAQTPTVASGNASCVDEFYRIGDRINNRVAGVMIYPVALSPGEIETIAKRRQLGPLRTMPAVDIRLDSCPDGASGDGVTFPDRSGNGKHGLGDNGAEGAGVGLTCRASEFFRREWGPQ